MYKKEKAKIEFIARFKNLTDIEEIRPQPAHKFIPEWWKTSPWDIETNLSHRPEGHLVKQCPMFPDFFSSGYILPMWADTIIYFNENSKEWLWKCGSTQSPFKIDIFQNEQFLKNQEYKMHGLSASAIFQFHNPWQIKTTSKYYIFQLPLFYHFNNNFSVLPGTYDASVALTNKLEVAYFGNAKEIFIKKGTPLAQYIPYKKEKINYIIRELNQNDINENEKGIIKRATMFKNFYAKNKYKG
jgi:hypothetical protein